MKKFASFVLALAMAAVCAAPAMAEGADSSASSASSGATTKLDANSDTGNTMVQFYIAPAYTVTIPTNVTLDKTGEGAAVTYEKDLELTASNVRLEKGKELHITISNANDYKLTAGNAELAYTIDDKTPGTTDVVATFETKTADQTATLHIKAGNPTYAGNYSGTLQFTIAVV
ncbi:hypothetical protein [uncultured Gemmiger sp.]|uniref:hypothetical protein n=1 Tax=uncultured Gemmiger sp. TaxID=1623490 RepID=UPI0025EE5C95|nr:hypothetical protein [uncultured Gemmiger sp.]